MKVNSLIQSVHLIGIVLLMTSVWSCDKVKEYTDPTDNTPPGKVTAVTVENLHGGAMITYSLPADNDLLGVKAVYKFHENGQEYEVYSSAHRDTIILEGFPDTQEYIVFLYTIDLSKNLSEPVRVSIKPLTPPVDLIRQSLKVSEVFGGIYCTWENTFEENIALSLYVDSIGEMTLDDTYFSKSSQGKYSFRGFPSKNLSFRIEIRDRWMNFSEPLDTVLTPLFEERIWGVDPVTGVVYWSIWGQTNRECLSRGESFPTDQGGNPFSYVMDNSWTIGNAYWEFTKPGFANLASYIPDYPNKDQFSIPSYYTIDMGRSSKLSRFRKHLRCDGSHAIMPWQIEFEAWGTNNPKAVIPESTNEDRLTNLRYWTSWKEIGGTDEWKNDWVQLGDYVITLPSGASRQGDILTTEDEQYAIYDGVNFDVDPDKTNIPLRYIRIVCKKSTWTTLFQDCIAEYVFFGELIK